MNSRRARLWLVVGALFIPTVVLFWDIVFAGRVLFWGVPLMQFGPWYQLAVDAIRAGEVPLWNPLVGNGAPLLANYQSALFYPPNWLHLLIPSAQAMSSLMVAHVLWAGLGMWFFSRALGLRPLARLVSALSFMLSGYFVSRLAFPSIGSAFSWIAWLLWAGERLVVERRVWKQGTVLGFCLGMQWLSGHAQTSFYSGLALGAFLLWRSWSGACRSRREFWELGKTAVLAGLLAFGIAAVQLLPTAELQQLSQRAGGVEYSFAMTYSLWPLRLIAFLAPRFFGHPATGNYWGYCCNYWEDNAYVGLLPLLLAVAAVGRAIKTRGSGLAPKMVGSLDPGSTTPFFAGLALLGLILAFGVHTPIYPLVFRYVPGFGQFQAPARLLCFWTVGVSVLAGIGAEKWRPTWRMKRLGRYGIVTGLGLLIAAGGSCFISSGKLLTFVVGLVQLGVSLVLIGLLILRQPTVYSPDLPLSREQERGVFRWSVLVYLLIAVDLVSANWGANPTAEQWLYERPTESAAALRAAGLEGRIFYLSDDEYAVTYDHYLNFQGFSSTMGGDWFGMRETLLPNLNILDQIPSANNFDPLLSARFLDLENAVNLAESETQLELLRMMGVEILVTESERPDLVQAHKNRDVVFSFVPDPLPRAYIVFAAQQVAGRTEALQAVTDPAFDPGQVVILESQLDISPEETPRPPLPVALTSNLNSVTIRAALPVDGYLVLLDTWYPGWQVMVDGDQALIHPANLAFRAVPLSSGEHEVVFEYRPFSFWLGVLITGFTWLLLSGLLVGRWVAERRD